MARRRFQPLAALLCALVPLALPAPATAESGANTGAKTSAKAPLTRHFDGFNSCYARVYSKDHLARHPQQKVTHMSLAHLPHVAGPFGADGKALTYPAHPEIVVNLSVVMRGGAGADVTAFCWPQGNHMACGLECDGGQFELHDRGGKGLLLKLKSTLHLSDCGAAAQRLDPQPDDRSFLLYELPDTDCIPSPGQ